MSLEPDSQAGHHLISYIGHKVWVWQGDQGYGPEGCIVLLAHTIGTGGILNLLKTFFVHNYVYGYEPLKLNI